MNIFKSAILLAVLSCVFFDCFSQSLVPCYSTMPDKSKKWGFCDRFYLTTVIKSAYDSVYDFADGLAKVKLNDKYGYVDKAGKLVIPAKFEASGDFHEGFTVVQANGRFLYIDKKGMDVFKRNFKNAAYFSDGLAMVSDDEGKIGFVDKTGKMIIPHSYKIALPFSEGLAPVSTGDRKWKVINKKGETVFEFPENVISATSSFSEGKLPVTVLDKSSNKLSANYLDKTGALLCKDVFTSTKPFHGGAAIVTSENTERRSGNNNFFFYHLINSEGKIVTSQKYPCLEETEIPGIYFYGSSSVGLSNCDGYGLMNASGKQISPASYSSFVKLCDTAFLCKEAGKSSLKNYLVLTTSGKTPVQVSKQNRYYEIVGKDTLLVLYTEIGEKTYSTLYNIKTGLIKDGMDDGFYLLRKQGLIVFEDYKSFWGSIVSADGSIVMKNIQTFFLRDYNRNDSPPYDQIPFMLVKTREDKAMRLFNINTRKFMDTKFDFGEEAFDFGYRYSEGMLAVVQNEKVGFIDSTGKLKIPCKYETGGTFHDGWSKVSKAKGEFDQISTWVNKAGQEMPGIIAEENSEFYEGIAKYTVKPKEPGDSPTKLVYINKAGKAIFTTDFAEIRKQGDFKNGMCAVRNKEGKYGYINTKGELVIQYLYRIPYEKEYTFYIDFDSSGFAKVEKDGKIIRIDKTGKEY